MKPVQEEDKSLNVSAYIKSLSVTGDLEIEFNSTMFTYFNFSELNSSFVDIYVEAAEDRWDYPGFNMSSLNLTWSLLSYEQSTMVIKIKFNDPYSLSPLVTQDQICVHILNETSLRFFHSTVENKDLHPEYWTLYKNIKKQMIDDEAS